MALFSIPLVLVQLSLATATIIYRKNYFYNSATSPNCEGTPYSIGALPTDTCLTYGKRNESDEVNGYSTTEFVHIKYSAVQSGGNITFTTTYYTDSTCMALNGLAADNTDHYGLDVKNGKVDIAAATLTDVVSATCFEYENSDRGYTQYSLGDTLVNPTENGVLLELYTGSSCSSTSYGYEHYPFDACAYWFPLSDQTTTYNESSYKWTYNSTTGVVTRTVYVGRYCSGDTIDDQSSNFNISAQAATQCFQSGQFYAKKSIYSAPTSSPTLSPTGPSYSPSRAPTTARPSTLSPTAPTAAPTQPKVFLSKSVGVALSFAGIATHVGLFLLQLLALPPSTSSADDEGGEGEL